jgi:hypothetical protein
MCRPCLCLFAQRNTAFVQRCFQEDAVVGEALRQMFHLGLIVSVIVVDLESIPHSKNLRDGRFARIGGSTDLENV